LCLLLELLSEILKSPDQCVKCLRNIAGFLQGSKKILTHKENFIISIQKFCDWTLEASKIVKLFSVSSSTRTIETILHLTTILEYSLGNIYWTVTKKSPPHLIRDLLETSEIKSVFGNTEVTSHIIIGHLETERLFYF
jgi:hypothetical protein